MNMEPFILGAPEFWDHHSNHYDHEQDDEEDNFDIVNINSRKNKININVKKVGPDF